LKYDGDVQVGGRLASVGQRLLDTVSKSMIRQGLETVNSALKARVAAKAGAQEVEFKPPSETEFAAAVAKDVAGSVLSSRVVWIVAAVLILIVIVALIRLGAGGGG
jgi:hypothetical protein